MSREVMLWLTGNSLLLAPSPSSSPSKDPPSAWRIIADPLGPREFQDKSTSRILGCPPSTRARLVPPSSPMEQFCRDNTSMLVLCSIPAARTVMPRAPMLVLFKLSSCSTQTFLEIIRARMEQGWGARSEKWTESEDREGQEAMAVQSSFPSVIFVVGLCKLMSLTSMLYLRALDSALASFVSSSVPLLFRVKG
eukprot:759154-Hanusia_phi.AAC.3